jgi:RecB family exonuclease
MIDQEIFTKFNLEKDMLPFSASKIKTWKNNPAQFVLKYIYGYPTTSNHAMERGTAVEFGLNHLFTNNYSVENCYEKAITYYKSSTALLDKEDDKQYEMIAPMVELCFEKLSPLKDHFLSFQGRIDTTLLGVPIYGFTDYVFQYEHKILVIDLKTKAKFMPTHDDMLQMAIYQKAFEEKFDKPVDIKLLICTPKRCETVDFVPSKRYLKEIEMHLMSCANVFNACNEPDDMKSFVVPNLDDWTWNSAELLEQRYDVWGI